MNVVIYARFSCHSQTEQSIEGQLKVCYEYAESNGYVCTLYNTFFRHSIAIKKDKYFLLVFFCGYIS